MALKNITNNHIPNNVRAQVTDLLQQATALLKPYCANLNNADRKKLKGLSGKKKHMVQRIIDIRNGDHSLGCPDVDWDEMLLDWSDRTFLEETEMKANIVYRMCSSQRMLSDADCLNNARTDYRHTVYKFTNGGNTKGWDLKYNELKEFMPRTGIKGKKKKERE